MTRLIEFTTREEAEDFAAKVDAAFGYPAIGPGVCTAVRVGGGRHIGHPHCCTVRHAEPLEGKTAYAYPVEERVRAITSKPVTDVLVTKTEINQEDFERKLDPSLPAEPTKER